MPDAHKNFAVSLIATAPSPATSGTSCVVTAGHGSRFPAVPFNATIWPGGQADPSNAEVVRVTARSTDTLTIVRAEEGSTARTVVVGDTIAATITNKTLVDAEYDPVADKFGAPTSAEHEFRTSSLTGLTALTTTPDVEDADTSAPDCLFMRDDSSASDVYGRYVAPPAAPWTAIAKILDGTVRGDYQGIGMMVGVTTPGALDYWRWGLNARGIYLGNWTNPTTFNTAIGDAGVGALNPPLYLAIRANSGTDVDYLWSPNGLTWVKTIDSRNPGFTIGSVGLAMNSQNTAGHAAAWDYLRIWSSALSMPGALA